MLLFYGVVIPEEKEMGHWSRRFIRWIEGIRMERASGDMALKIHLEELSHLRQIIAKLNRAILALARTEEYRSLGLVAEDGSRNQHADGHDLADGTG